MFMNYVAKCSSCKYSMCWFDRTENCPRCSPIVVLPIAVDTIYVLASFVTRRVIHFGKFAESRDQLTCLLPRPSRQLPRPNHHPKQTPL